jgi:hypothetical protein
MKLPRWLVIAMLTTSVLSVLAAAGCWWVTCPERTAREFCDLVREFRWTEAAKLCDDVPVDTDWQMDDEELKEWHQIIATARIEFHDSRSLCDLILACRRFRISYDNFAGDAFMAQRGKVIAETTQRP